MVILIPTDAGTNLSQEKQFNFCYTKAGFGREALTLIYCTFIYL